MAGINVVQFDLCNKNHIMWVSMLMACIAGCFLLAPPPSTHNGDLGVGPQIQYRDVLNWTREVCIPIKTFTPFTY
jgi:hypothetical protein